MIKTENYTYNEDTKQLTTATGYNLFVALNELFDFNIDLLKSYSAKNYKIVSNDLVFSGDFEDFMNMLNTSGKVKVNVAKSNRNSPPKHVIFIEKVVKDTVVTMTQQEAPVTKKKIAQKGKVDAE